MPKSKFVDFKAVKAAVSMEQVLQHYGLIDQFKRSANGESLSGPCPIHKGTNSTQFRVSLTKNCWNCFSGCEGGNVLDFVAKMENVSLHAAAVKLSEWFNLSAERPPSNPKEKSPVREAQTPPADRPVKRSNPPPPDGSTPNKPLGFQLENLDLSRAIVMLDEDDAGRAGRESILPRLATWLFVKTHIFAEPEQQPEHLSADEVRQILGD